MKRDEPSQTIDAKAREPGAEPVPAGTTAAAPEARELDDPELLDRLFIIFDGLAQQGPGDDASTRRALSLVPGLPPSARALDVGCGSGRTSLVLARETRARIDAVDLLQPLVDRLRASVEALGLQDRVFPRQGDMTCLPFEPGTFQLIWSEGAIYQMGFEAGLRAWRPLLAAGGHVVVTEVAWLVDDPPEDCRRYWDREYPAITSVQRNLELARAAGYSVVGHFPLPERSWWDGYYTPLSRNLDRLEAGGLSDDPLLAELVAASREELALFERHGGAFGYVFFVLRG